ncbi:putative short-chain dehydrogenase/reductase SDR, NAD(P)-binding domain superfamily [Plasmopara halstedii]
MGINSSKEVASRPQVPSNWNSTDIPSQKDKVVIVTGANSGIGFEIALQLARKGAHVILACRNEKRGLQAEADIQQDLKSLSDAGSVKFMQNSRRCTSDYILINNAGIGGRTYATTADGFELIFATNYLGPFVLTAQLFDLLKKTAPSRIVSVSSFLHWYGTWVFDEDQIMVKRPKEHGQLGTYSVSKVCFLLFTNELDRRLKAAGIDNIITTTAHPGYCDTSIMGDATKKKSNWYWWLSYRPYGIYPPQNFPKDYFRPKYLELYGHPIREEPAKLSKSETAVAKLWAYSEELAHLKFDVTK